MFVSEESLRKVVDYLKSHIMNKPAHLTFFLALKYMGISEHPIIQQESRELSEEAIFYLMSLYDEHEQLPERNHLVYPFDITDRSVTVDIRRFARNDIFNNIRNNPDRYKGIIRYSIESSGGPAYLLERDYLDNLKNALEITPANRISIKKLAGWIYRTRDLSYGGTIPSPREFTKYVLNLFRKQFHITPEEEEALFTDDDEDLTPSTQRTPMAKIRQWINFSNPSPVTAERLILVQPSKAIKDWAAFPPGKNPSVDEVYQRLLKSKQVILYGPPGTSKTYVSKQLMSKFDHSVFVQFHQSFGYEEFIGGVRPVGNHFEPVPGILTSLVDEAKGKPKETFLLVIDEINRGNLARIFGETITILDRDMPSVILSYDKNKKIQLHENIYIVGTMNTADRSIAIVDYAMRRRFEWLYFSPDPQILENVTNDSGSEMRGISIVNLFTKINNRISEFLGRELQLGHTYFMPNSIRNSNTGEYDWTLAQLESTINTSVLPLIEEYCYGNQSLLTSILGEDIQKRLTGQSFKDAVLRYLAQ